MTTPPSTNLPTCSVADKPARAGALYALLMALALGLIFSALLFDRPADILRGLMVILGAPCNLLTDYFALAGVGAALANSGIMVLLSVGLIALCRAEISGMVVSSVFMVAGFSLFGKNPLNALPLILGVAFYSWTHQQHLRDNLPAALLGTCLGPMVSQVAFAMGLPKALGLPLGMLAGFVAGVMLMPLSRHLLAFHKGYNIYNIGFTAGIIGSVFVALLRAFGVNIPSQSLVAFGNNGPISVLLYGSFLLLLIVGLYENGWSLKGYNNILRFEGPTPVNFLTTAGLGPVFINMALLGLITTSAVLLVGGELNGPVVGGIFGVVGFGAAGKNPHNYLPVMAGCLLMGVLQIQDIHASPAVLAALFSSTLSPISGRYGPLAGMMAGVLHMAVVGNVGVLHAGLNLYNNGFAGGFVAGAFLPILDCLELIAQRRQSDGLPE